MSATPKLTVDPVELPLLPLRDVVVFPHMVIPLFVGRPKSIKALEVAMEAGKSILLVAQKSAVKDDPEADDLYSVGCVANILQMLKLPGRDGQGSGRGRAARPAGGNRGAPRNVFRRRTAGDG
jgi:ATP-dependent Lon protease